MADSKPEIADEVAAVANFMVERDLFAEQLGIQLEELRLGRCRASLHLTPSMLNGHGLPHGAIIFALADFAFAGACNSHGRTAVALSMDIHFLSSPRPDARLEAIAEEVRLGRRTGLYRISVTDDEDTLVAELHGMAYRKKDRFI
jgi:acyl-CoA thioesterase